MPPFFILRYVKKLQKKQILFARTSVGITRISFYEVIKATSNTCELRELKKEIVNQTHDEQEVTPIMGEYCSHPFRRKVSSTGSVKIADNLHAWPWDGKNQWQSVIIFVP